MPKTSASTTDRALTILYHCAASRDGCSFSELKEVGGDLASMTLSRILNTLLENDDLIKADSGLYHIGPRFQKAARAANNMERLEDILEPIIQRLAQKTDESSAYFHWDGDWIYIRVKTEMPERFHYTGIGFRNHPLGHTFFRPIQAHLDPKTLKKLKNDSDVGELLDTIRQQGYFTQEEEYRTPIFRVTAPVFYGEHHKIAGCLGITSLISDLEHSEIQQYIDCVCESAAEANALLAHMEHVA